MKIFIMATFPSPRRVALASFEADINWVPLKLGDNVPDNELPLQILEVSMGNEKGCFREAWDSNGVRLDGGTITWRPLEERP